MGLTGEHSASLLIPLFQRRLYTDKWRHCFPLGDKPTPECREEVYLWQMASKLEFYSYKKDMCIGIVTTVDVCTLVFSVDECKTSHNVIKVNVR